ncbi:hypothetical protein [Ferrimicrobium sp.]|nr:hypothetical protein [Ferrimicrobium sp.]
MSARSHQAWSVATTIATNRGFYLAEGTGLAIHLHHRRSTDLDFFVHDNFDPDEILTEINRSELPVAVTGLADGTLNVLCDSVVVQFLSVAGQEQLSPTSTRDTANLAAIPDILAMKLNAVLGRAKLRDYFDLMVIDQRTGYSIENGIGLFLRRYRPAVPDQSVATLIRSLGYLDDVEDDATVPVARQQVVDFWNSRSVDVAKHTDRYGVIISPSTPLALEVLEEPSDPD